MGKIVIFSQDTCPYCKKAKELLQVKGAEFEDISLTVKPEWRQFMFLLTNGMLSLSLSHSLTHSLTHSLSLSLTHSLSDSLTLSLRHQLTTHYIHVGRSSVPEVFFNRTLIGGLDELENLDQQGKLDGLITDCLSSPTVDFPPPFRRPEGKEFLKVHVYVATCRYIVHGLVHC
jgi:glutaredoxin